MQPGADPTKSEGSLQSEPIMGGRFLQSNYSGAMMGQPFHGMAIDGFDNKKQKYIGTWMDTMGTMMMVFEGDLDESGKVRTMVANFTDAFSGQPAQMKGITRIVSDDEHVYEGWMTAPDGSLFKTMEIVYTRA